MNGHRQEIKNKFKDRTVVQRAKHNNSDCWNSSLSAKTVNQLQIIQNGTLENSEDWIYPTNGSIIQNSN